MNRFALRASRTLIACACAAALGTAHAQAESRLPPVVITGNPLGASEIAAPVESLSGAALLLRAQSSLGETLNSLPGVSSTYFGPTASRPIIRGLDGDRIRILSNSASLADVSSLSYDHAVSADPITIERIEVLRGPAALLHGGNAIGGVVNLIDNRIPRAAAGTTSGRADLGYASGSRETSGAVLVEGGTRQFAWHADAFERSGRAVRVPTALPCDQGGTLSVASRICNSQAEARGGALGASTFWDGGFAGISTSTFESHYGAVSEDEVAIRMRSRRHALEAEWRRLPGFIEGVKLQASTSRYRHAEEEGGAVGTLFLQSSTDLRVEARHAPVGPVTGVWGVQLDSARFAAEGDEAFAPPSRTRQSAIFAFEEWKTGWGRVTAGARAERVRVRSFESASAPRFTQDERRFSPVSGAAGVVWNLDAEWQLTGHVAHSERAPKDYELFADGPHVATGAYERGDAGLGIERSRSAEAGVQWSRGENKLRLSAYATSFRDFIALSPTGAEVDGLPEFAYRQTRARMRGFEASGSVRLLDGPHTVDLQLRADAVRADDQDRGEPLARIAPARLGADLNWTHGPWSAVVGIERHAKQDRVPAGAPPTGGFTLMRTAITYRAEGARGTLVWYARIDNASDRLAFSSTSILSQTAPGRVPLPGRSVKLGVQASF